MVVFPAKHVNLSSHLNGCLRSDVSLLLYMVLGNLHVSFLGFAEDFTQRYHKSLQTQRVVF